MKFINKFGVIDLIIVVIMVLVVGVGVNKFLIKDTSSNEKVKIEYLLESDRVTSDSNVNIGKENLYHSIKNYDMGEVVESYKKPAKVESEDVVNGLFRLEESSIANNVYVKVKADADVSEKAIVLGDEPLRVGEKYPIKGSQFSAEFVVLEIKVLKK